MFRGIVNKVLGKVGIISTTLEATLALPQLPQGVGLDLHGSRAADAVPSVKAGVLRQTTVNVGPAPTSLLALAWFAAVRAVGGHVGKGQTPGAVHAAGAAQAASAGRAAAAPQMQHAADSGIGSIGLDQVGIYVLRGVVTGQLLLALDPPGEVEPIHGCFLHTLDLPVKSIQFNGGNAPANAICNAMVVMHQPMQYAMQHSLTASSS